MFTYSCFVRSSNILCFENNCPERPVSIELAASIGQHSRLQLCGITIVLDRYRCLLINTSALVVERCQANNTILWKCDLRIYRQSLHCSGGKKNYKLRDTNSRYSAFNISFHKISNRKIKTNDTGTIIFSILTPVRTQRVCFRR